MTALILSEAPGMTGLSATEASRSASAITASDVWRSALSEASGDLASFQGARFSTYPLMDRMKAKRRSSPAWNWNCPKRTRYSARVDSQSLRSSCSGSASAPAAGTDPAANRVVMLSTRFTRLPRSFARSPL